MNAFFTHQVPFHGFQLGLGLAGAMVNEEAAKNVPRIVIQQKEDAPKEASAGRKVALWPVGPSFEEYPTLATSTSSKQRESVAFSAQRPGKGNGERKRTLIGSV